MTHRIIITESQLNSIVHGNNFNIKNVYHVSDVDFNTFKNNVNFSYMFFSNKPIELYGKNNIVYICNLSIHKPLIFDCNTSWSYPLWLYLSDKHGYLIPEEEFTFEKFDGYLGCPFELWKFVYYDDFEYDVDQLPELVKELNMGYDGVIIKNIGEGDTSITVDDYVVFNPEQVEIVKKIRK